MGGGGGGSDGAITAMSLPYRRSVHRIGGRTPGTQTQPASPPPP